MGKIQAICISEKRGTVKYTVEEAKLIEDFGIEGDAHAGNGTARSAFYLWKSPNLFIRMRELLVKIFW